MDFPEILYVCEEGEGHEHWWEAEASPHDLADTRRPRRLAGIYRLVGMGEVVTGVTVEQKDSP